MSDYYSVIQLLATLAIGFVILGYSDNFIETLKNKVFRIDDSIGKAEEECLSYMPDRATRDNLKPIKVGNGDTYKDIEVLRLKCEDNEKRIKDFMGRSRKDLDKMTKLRSLIPMSLFVFLATVVMLFVPNMKWCEEYVHLSLVPFSSLCVIYLVFGWIFGERENNRKLIKFESLKHPITLFVAFCVISIAYAFFAKWRSLDLGDLWLYLSIGFVFAGWLNFLMYAIFIKNSAHRVNKAVEEWKKPFIEECKKEDFKKQCDFLFKIMLIDGQATKLAVDFTQKQESTDTPTPPTDPE